MSRDNLADQFGRKFSHLRLSLTDQCNFRCVYCMPPEGLETLSQQKYLHVDEIKRLVKIFSSLGVDKVRLTGGEPLLRSDVLTIVDKISNISGVHDLALTTNGTRLKRLAKHLRDFGLKRINISLDSLNPVTFKKMSLRQNFNEVMDGILEALHVGFPVKINVVVMKGMNDHEIEDFINFALNNPVKEVRFIEFMPLCGTGWKPQHVYSMVPWIKEIQEHYNAKSVNQPKDSVAKSFTITKNGKTGRVGFITTVSNPFCGQCSRIRMTVDGVLRPCLFSNQGTSLKKLMREGASDQEIITAIQETVWKKEKGNEFNRAKADQKNFDYYLNQNPDSITDNPHIRSIGG